MKQPSFFDHPRGFDRPLSHSEFFEKPLDYASGFHSADIRLRADGIHPQTHNGEVVIIRPDNYVSPGTFGSVRKKLVKAKSKASIRQWRWLNPHEHAKATAAAERRRRLLEGIWYQPPPKITVENHKGELVERAPRISDHEHAATEAGNAVQRERLKTAVAPPEPVPEPPSTVKQIALLNRVLNHNGVQHTGAQDEPRLRCPEAERAEARQRRRLARQHRPPVTAAERAAALALLASEITVPRPTLPTVTEAPPPPVQTLAAVAPSAWGASRL